MESDVDWHRSNHHNNALDLIKKILTENPTLKYYDLDLPTKTSVDASKFGLGVVLLFQKHGDTWAPVAYASRSLRRSEQNYAQIEKEALAIMFGCECFHVYLYRKSFIEFKPGRELTIADTMSRVFIAANKQYAENKAEFQVHLIMSSFPISEIN